MSWLASISFWFSAESSPGFLSSSSGRNPFPIKNLTNDPSYDVEPYFTKYGYDIVFVSDKPWLSGKNIHNIHSQEQEIYNYLKLNNSSLRETF